MSAPSEEDPPRWSSGADAPRFAVELVRGIERVPVVPPAIRHHPPRLPRPMTRALGATVATAVVLGGLVLWRLGPRERMTDSAPEVAPVAAPRDAGAFVAEVDAPDSAPEVAPLDAEIAPPEPVRAPRRRGRETADVSSAPPASEVVADDCDREHVGTLMIQTLPWARLFVDGRDTGRNTPVRELSLSAGHHELGLRTPDDVMHTLAVDVCGGETVRIVRQF